MKGYCSKCGTLVDETEQLRGVCLVCIEGKNNLLWKVKHDGVIIRVRKDE